MRHHHLERQLDGRARLSPIILLAFVATACGEEADPAGPRDADADNDARDAGVEDAALVEDVLRDPEVGAAGVDVPASPDASPDASVEPAPPACYTDGWGVPFDIPLCRRGESWPGSLVDVCFTDAAVARPDFVAVRDRLRDTLRTNWSRPTSITIFGFEGCDFSRLRDSRRFGFTDVEIHAWAVIDLVDGKTLEPAIGFGEGGQRHVRLGVAEDGFAARANQMFMALLGFGHANGGAAGPAPTPEEVIAVQLTQRNRRQGTMTHASGVCLGIPYETASAADGPPAGTLVGTDDCVHHLGTRWTRDRTSRLVLSVRPERKLVGRPGDGKLVLADLADASAGDATWVYEDVALVGLGDLCATVKDGLFVQGQPIVLAPCDGGEAQKIVWRVDGRFESHGFCLHAVGTIPLKSGSPLELRACDGSANQRFSTNASRLQNGVLCLTVRGFAPRPGASIGVETCVLRADPRYLAQRFYFRGAIRNGTRCLHMEAPYEPARASACDGSRAQLWEYVPDTLAP